MEHVLKPTACVMCVSPMECRNQQQLLLVEVEGVLVSGYDPAIVTLAPSGLLK